jgi:SAM-dependent methyltransferase
MTEISTPTGYGYDPDASHNFLDHAAGLLKTPVGENFWLTNRSWEEVNTNLGELPGIAIDYKLRTTPSTDGVTVLDIGSGLRGVAMHELQSRFEHADRKPAIVGIDLTHISTMDGPDNKIIGDATRLPLKSESVDVAYSSQSVTLMGDLSTDSARRELRHLAINEAVRALKPGGVFFIDLDIPYDRDFSKQHDLDRLSLPAGIRAYWEHRGPRDKTPVGRFLMAIIIKDDPANDTSELAQELRLRADREIEL